MNTSNIKKPEIASLLSLALPGLGQLYNGERSKGIALVAMVFGIVTSCIVFRSTATFVLMGVIYVAVLVPAVLDAYRVAKGRQSSLSGDGLWYVVGMLLVLGPFALPLLWQSPRFSRRSKIAWTILVILIALVGIAIVALLGSKFDQMKASLLND